MAEITESTTSTVAAPAKKNNKRYIWLSIIIIVFAAIAIVWWLNYRKYIKTDDANLDSFRIDVAARVMAPITSIYVWEGDTVKQGMLLLELDSSGVTSQLKEAQAHCMELEASLLLDQENLKTATLNLKLAEVNLQLAKDNFKRAEVQYKGEAITQEAYQEQQQAYESAQLRRDLSQNEITIAQAQIQAAKAALAAAQASVASVQTTLGYYRIYAPHDGVIAKRYFLPGDIIQPGQTLYTINQDKPIWVAVYLEETKFSNVKMGQEVDFTLDAYPHLKFKGNIFYIGSNSASEFALIPPNNASGNYTKVTQRIPIKVSIREAYDKHGKQPLPDLVSGMSVNIKIVKR